MICKWCNQQNPENNKFCMNCGKELNNTDNVNNNQNINNNLSQPNSQLPPQEEKASIGLAILSFFIPLVGLILFIIKKDKEPKTAKACGICALISFIINIILTIIILFSFVTISNMIIDTKDKFNNIDNNYNDNYYEDDYNNDNDNNDDDNLSDNQNTNDITTSTNWKDYEISINNTKITLPTTYNKLTEVTKANMKSAQEKSYLEKNHYTLANLYKNDKLALYIELTNNSENDLLYTECQVTRVSQTKYQVSQGAEIVIFPGGLKAGEKITESEIINLFGTPYDTNEYSSEGYESKTYKYVENTTWTTTNNYEITVVNGIIDTLKLDNRN